MPRLHTAIALVGPAALAATAPAALGVRTARPAEAKAIPAALTPAVAQVICAQVPVGAADCAASTFSVRSIRIAEDDPKYAWVAIMPSGPARDSWFAQDGDPWRNKSGKWTPIPGGGGCSYPVMKRLPKPVYTDFGAEYCGIRPPCV